jgi:hypothetical protein
MPNDYRTAGDMELITQLRMAANVWFRKEDLMALEELIFRFRSLRNVTARQSVRGESP